MKYRILFITFFTTILVNFAFAKTICSITINSKNEINVFKRNANKSDRFIELTKFQTGLDKVGSWLENACDEQVQCDTLIISGHFAGSFFGNRNFELELDQLKNASCKKSCRKLFENTKEVYLFGCNTLSQKGSDLSNLDLYFNDLIRSGYNQSTADRLRRNIIYNDGTYINTMRSIFSNADLILGFNDKAPLGSVIENPLEKSLKNDSKTVHFSTLLKKTVPHISTTNGLKLNVNPFCGLEKMQESKESQLEWLQQAMKVNHKVDNSLDLKIVLYHLIQNNTQQSILTHLLKSDLNEFAKRIENFYLNTPDVLIDQKINYLEILALLSPEKYKNEIENYWLQFKISSNQTQFNYQDTEKICTSKIHHVFSLKEKNINPKLYDNKNFLLALGCLLPQDQDIQKQLVRQLDSMDLIIANTAYYALNNYKLDHQSELVTYLQNTINNSYSPYARKYAQRLLKEK